VSKRLIFLLLGFYLSLALAVYGLSSYDPLDTFNRANTGPPPSTQWSSPVLSGQIGLKVVSNTLAGSATQDSSYWNVRTFPGDVSMAVTLTAITTLSRYVRLYIRLASPGVASTTTGYLCQAVFESTAAASGLTLRRVDAGVPGVNLGQTLNITWAVGDAIGCEMRGTQLCMYRRPAGSSVWGSATCLTDATYTTAGFVGVGLNGVEITVDDFWAGALGRKGRARFLD